MPPDRVLSEMLKPEPSGSYHMNLRKGAAIPVGACIICMVVVNWEV